ncbi:MAG: HIT domain-containing protein [Spirochaetes bacterium]|nr:HIT domain-containing protein [Spirochaetota bacterium]
MSVHSDENCIFCKIASGKIPSKKIAENDEVIAFHDIAPKAPVHFLVLPKTHVTDIMAMDAKLMGACLAMIQSIAGFRVINNCGANAGQTVMHAHFHVISGKMLGFE